jgi:hypothetical protein
MQIQNTETTVFWGVTPCSLIAGNHISDSTASHYWLRAGRPRGRSLSWGKNFLPVVQTGSGVHSTSYPVGTGGSFPGDKAAGA